MTKNLLNCFAGLSILLISLSLPSYAQKIQINPKKLHIKLDDSLAIQLSVFSQSILSTSYPSLAQLNQSFEVKEMKRVFPYAGKYEYAHRSYELHQWYEIEFQDTLRQEVKEVIQHYMQNSAVQWAEPVYEMSLDVTDSSLISMNDPRLKDQWHYQNTGQSGGTVGADIQLPDAWNIETGDSSVIVAIIDGGMDINHEDLKEAMWVNQAELNGTKGLDDDNNGYVDDVNGYGFGDRRGEFLPHRHGIHVGGTVGAINNNDKGVAGIAGGSGTADGVRLMSCAVFGSYSQGGFPESFVYAADNGAVIAQNSWGGGAQSQVLEDAIDYFIARAGYDNSEENYDKNLQTGPMAGGIVFFAAGNNNSSYPGAGYPGSYESCFSVASTDHNDHKSSFSNYGDWVEISAPGTDVLSTYTGNGYGYLSGTSMACPHVSGVAALIVSKYGKEGFKPDQVKHLLLSSAENIDPLNPYYKGKLGAGRLNAYQALFSDDDQVAPAPIADLKIDSVSFGSMVLSWTASGADSLRGIASKYDIRYAQQPITAANFDQATVVNQSIAPKAPGQKENTIVDGLPAETKLYLVIKAIDLNGLGSEISNVVDTTTTGAPFIEVNPDSLSAELSNGDSLSLELRIDNSQGKSTLTYQLSSIESAQNAINTSENESSRVLVVQSYADWGFYMQDFLKKEFDISPDVIIHNQMDEKDFSEYQLIIVTGGQNYSHTRLINAQVDKFEAYVRQGGVVLYLIAGYNDVNAPAGAFINNGYNNTQNQKSIPHLINRNIPESINSSFASSGRIQNLPEKSLILTTYENGQYPTTALFPLDKGEVILSCMYWEKFYKDQEKGIQNFLKNATEYALYSSKSHQWLEYPESGQVAAGLSQDLSVSFLARGLASGTYQQQLVVSSNDPLRKEVKIPVTLKVNSAPVLVTSTDSLHFDNLFVGQSMTDTLTISNLGPDTLSISSIEITSSAYNADVSELILSPYADQQIELTFAPERAGEQHAILTFKSKLPDYQVKLSGRALEPPIIATNTDTIKVNLYKGHETNKTISIQNQGGSALNWNLNIAYTHYEPENTTVDDNYSLGKEENFKTKAFPFGFNYSASTLTAAVGYPFIFTKQYYSSSFYKYDVKNGRWEQVANMPNANFVDHTNGASLKDKIYYITSEKTNFLFSYDINEDKWTRLSAPEMASNPVFITSDDTHLYILFANGALKQYDPEHAKWKSLATQKQNTYRGMAHYGGRLYVHTSHELYSYDIKSNIWEKLKDTPNILNNGSAVEPYEQFLYTASGSTWNIYDIRKNKWYIAYNPLGGSNTRTQFTYLGLDDYSGVYFFRGSTFGQYVTRPYVQWIQPEQIKGSIAKSDSIDIVFNIKTDELTNGEYAALLNFNSNDPHKPNTKITVILSVYGDTMEYNAAPVVTDSLHRQALRWGEEVYRFNLAKHFADPEGYPLKFSARSRNPNIVLGNVEGSLLEVKPLDTGSTVLDLIIEDIKGKGINFSFGVSITHADTVAGNDNEQESPEPEQENQAPHANQSELHYILELNQPISVRLDSLFTDPDNDSLWYVSIGAVEEATQFFLSTDSLYIKPFKPGSSSITLAAYDPDGASVLLTLNTSVNTSLQKNEALADIALEKGKQHIISLRDVVENLLDQKVFFNSTVEDTSIVSTLIIEDELHIEALEIGQTSVQVEVSDEYGISLPFSFDVSVNALLSVDGPLFQQTKLKCYPNPSSEGTYIQFWLKNSEQVWLGVYSAEGKLVSILVDEKLSAGNQSIYWDTQGIVHGSYVIRLISNNKVENNKLLVLPIN
ncbi:S8 family serine peptidase [Catalinimonas sp. 4WD22]|uniref:S8 family serine peptidase n=1 Tax=Catalinimonas locisalis TaxID=3133978 RepID=UPI0031012F98